MTIASRSRALLVALAAPLLGACVLKGDPISPYGRHATVHQSGAGRFSGELIAVTGDSLWLMADSVLVGFSGANVRKIDVRRHRMGGGRTLTWMALAGGGTGMALLLSCESYNAMPDEGGAECGPVFPAAFLSFMAAGGLFALGNEYSSKHHLSARDTERLRAYARFPQGLPDSLPARMRRP